MTKKTIRVRAIYEKHGLRPIQKLPIRENAKVRLVFDDRPRRGTRRTPRIVRVLVDPADLTWAGT